MFELLYGVTTYLLERSVAAGVVAQGVTVGSRFSLNVPVILIGLVIVALAEAFHHGSGLQAESDLTV